MTLRLGSLCTGYGGLDQGVQMALDEPVQHTWHVEYDKHPAAILKHRYPGVPNHHDLTKVDWSTLEPIDLLTAGYPCQPFSGNGQRAGTDDPRHLWPHVARAVRTLRPAVVFLENVEDHLTLGFAAVLADLAASGFDAEWCVLRASDVGAPHGRPRLFIAAADPSRFVHEAARPRWLAGPVRPQPAPPSAERLPRPGARDDADQGPADPGGTDWQEYGPAVARWESVLGRPAPAPLLDRAGLPDVNPAFVEWTMGLPPGWVTDVPNVPVAAQLKALGNGVVPQQAAAAWHALVPSLLAALGAAA